MSYLYVISEGVNGPCKIGFANDVRKRLQAMMSGNYRKLTIVYQCLIDHRPHVLEHMAHAIVWRHRLAGEWFDITEQTAIDAVNQAIAASGSISKVIDTETLACILPAIRPVKPPSAMFLARHPEWMKN